MKKQNPRRQFSHLSVLLLFAAIGCGQSSGGHFVKASVAGVSQVGQPCTSGTYACGAVNADGQDTINVCDGGVFVKLDDCNDSPNNKCAYIANEPFCVFGTGGGTTPAPPPTSPPAGGGSGGGTPPGSSSGVTQVGQSCTSGTYACGAVNAAGQDTINICDGGVFVKLDDCNDSPNNKCAYIANQPYCVAGMGGGA
jgi:hypothetical protein